MAQFDHISEKSDSLIALLADQCADLERLLALARRETDAAEARNFEAVLEIVSERAQLTDRLEVFQHRIGELRQYLGAAGESLLRQPAARQVSELASQILAQDQTNTRLLASARQEAAAELSQLESSQTKVNSYLGGQSKGLAYSRQF